MPPQTSKPPAKPGSLARKPGGRQLPPQGPGGRFVSPREAEAEPAASSPAPSTEPAPAPRPALNLPPPHVGAGASSRGPTAEQANAVIASVTKGSFHADAFAEQGISWHVATVWLKHGEASFKLHCEDGRALTWQGELFKRLRKADADARSPVMHKLHEQAKAEGGANATRYLEARGDLGLRSGGDRVGHQRARDYLEIEQAAGAESVTDEELLQMVNGVIEAAKAAAVLRKNTDTGASAG
jgi:hypothetical protein